MSTFRTAVAQNYNPASIQSLPPDGSSTFLVGDLWYFDTATQTAKKCGANPALIGGISPVNTVATAPAQTGQSLTEDGRVPLPALWSNTIVAMCASTTPALTHIGNMYAITDQGSGMWQVNLASSGANDRVIVRDIDATNGICYVQYIAGNLQFDAIVA